MSAVESIADGDRLWKLAIRHDVIGETVILLDGVDVSKQVKGYQVNAQAGDLFPRVMLDLSAHATHDALVDGLARVTVIDREPLDPGPAAVVFLAAIDPVTLEETTLNRADLDNEPGSLTRALLRQLEEWARGRS